MTQGSNKVVGYFAYASPTEVVCTGETNACVISGSVALMKKYIERIDPDSRAKRKIKKTTFGEVLRGMEHGAAYAFDEVSYARFYPLARKHGLPVEKADFSTPEHSGNFFTVQLKGL
jgi:hypothetical protein